LLSERSRVIHVLTRFYRERRSNTENIETTNTSATVGAQGAAVAPEKETSKKTASQKKGAPKGWTSGSAGKTSLAEIMEVSSWQAHSVSGFVSGTLGKKMGLTVNSEKREDGSRVYSIAK
jgi:hypothetical protein